MKRTFNWSASTNEAEFVLEGEYSAKILDIERIHREIQCMERININIS
jgi:hypothetical protein